MRVSSLPTVLGEKIVIRVLDSDTSRLRLEDMDFTTNNLALYRDMYKSSYGLVLITGPTGSGKTTTLYATLQELNRPERNIVTVEDPVECCMEGVNQVAVNTKAGLTFASGLRSILRQDPNIIMIGEIRDRETAEISIQAALTGHLFWWRPHCGGLLPSAWCGGYALIAKRNTRWMKVCGNGNCSRIPSIRKRTEMKLRGKTILHCIVRQAVKSVAIPVTGDAWQSMRCCR